MLHVHLFTKIDFFTLKAPRLVNMFRFITQFEMKIKVIKTTFFISLSGVCLAFNGIISKMKFFH